MLPETQAYANLLCDHLKGLTHRLRKLSPEHWDWTPDVAAPTARTLAVHTWQWLQCDRQHIHEPDAAKHFLIPEPPATIEEMCDALDQENETWRTMLLAFTPEELDAKRSQFNDYEMTVRDFICHMVQNTIYKHGQLSTLYFALGYDGKEPYSAPFPNTYYTELLGITKTA